MTYKDNKPFFSIVIPIYNVEKYLSVCIQSILNQSFAEYEIILVNDGSTDSSYRLCQEFQTLYPMKVKIFTKRNEGLLMTRVYGIERATGKYIISLDADDALRLDALALLYQAIIQNDADLVMFCASRQQDFSTKWNPVRLPHNTIIDKKDVYTLICASNALNNFVLKTFKREYYAGRAYYTNFNIVTNEEDLLQSTQVVDKAKKIVFLDEALYYYRDNSNSIINTYQANMFKSIEMVELELRNYALKWEKEKSNLMEILYLRNLRSCARVIREIIKRCETALKRKEHFKEISNSLFFRSAFSFVKVWKLGWVDGLLVISIAVKVYFINSVISFLFQKRRRKLLKSGEITNYTISK